MPEDLVESFSGIRGIYGKSITESSAKKYVLSYLKLLNPDIVVVGGDSRPSTPALKEAVFQALKQKGVKTIIDLGILPIQAAEYAVVKFGADGGVYISASHNEPEYNGFKFLKSDGAILYSDQSAQLIEVVHQAPVQSLAQSAQNQSITIESQQDQAISNYLDYLLERLGREVVGKIKKAHLKILADPNGGSAINVLDKLFERLGVEAEIINNQLGQFNRMVEPNQESLACLADKLKRGDYQFAVGFDCDADRAHIVISPQTKFAQEMGAALNGNYFLALACDSLLERTSGQVVVNNDASSYLTREVLKKHNAQVVEVEVGEMNVVKEMEKQQSIISGEGSCGGVIVPPIKCRDSIMAVCLILKLIAERGRPLSEILDNYPRYYLLKEKVKCQAEQALALKSKLEDHFRKQGFQIKKTGGPAGGLKALADENNFVWFRQSKTEPGAFRIWADGNNKQKVKQLIQQGLKAFNQFK